MAEHKKAIIIGAGPAGLTAAFELLKRTGIIPVILEKSGDIGGISKTIDFKGNRMDMGPHRFFSKSDRVMNWWLKIMPLDETGGEAQTITYHNKSRTLESLSGDSTSGPKTPNEKSMILIQRLTRIYYLRNFFSYPIQLTAETFRILGINKTRRIMSSYLRARLNPRKSEVTLEDFLVNKFGKELFLLFFKDYTEKVWGVPCNKISAAWGAQRIKGVSLQKAVMHALQTVAGKNMKTFQRNKQKTETSLIEQFLYPRKGPGQLWEEVAAQVVALGGEIHLNRNVEHIRTGGNVSAVETIHGITGTKEVWQGDYFFSTMPVQELVAGMGAAVPDRVQRIAAGLQYRDFINVGILLKKLSRVNKDEVSERLCLKDNWIYIQERDVKVGRLMIYNNWGTGMVKDPETTWIGMEYFCTKGDAFWSIPDADIPAIAIAELKKMDLADPADVLDYTIARMEKTYPAYFGTYDKFEHIRDFTDSFPNLFLIGRNGMHKYNNADHSMLTAMVAVDNIAGGVTDKKNIWAVNTEEEYHEEKKSA